MKHAFTLFFGQASIVLLPSLNSGLERIALSYLNATRVLCVPPPFFFTIIACIFNFFSFLPFALPSQLSDIHSFRLSPLTAPADQG